jgi:signal transduction histidine kinase
MAAQGNGLGLIGMRERALALGGQLDVIQRERGFKLRAVIPFGTPAKGLP